MNSIKHTRKKIFSLILSLALLLTAIPQSGFSPAAADETEMTSEAPQETAAADETRAQAKAAPAQAGTDQAQTREGTDAAKAAPAAEANTPPEGGPPAGAKTQGRPESPSAAALPQAAALHETETEQVTEPESELRSVPEAEAGTGTRSEPEAQAGQKAEPEPGTEAAAGQETEPGPGTEAAAGQETEPGPGTTTEPGHETEPEGGQKAQASSESEAEAATEPETETRPETETGTEPATETAAEKATEAGTEPETEEEAAVFYSVCFEAAKDFTFMMDEGQVTYREGDTVSFEVSTAEDCLLENVEVFPAEEAFVPAGPGPDTSLLVLDKALPLRQDPEPADRFSFTMPASDVLLTASVLKAAAPTLHVRLDNGGIKSVPKAWVTEGSTWAPESNSIGYTVYRAVEMPDGKRRVCYCLQPPLAADGEGNYTATELTEASHGKISAAEAALIRKGLFYCYGGPGWETGDILGLLSDCSDKWEYYVASHFILSKIYTDAVGGEWNQVVLSGKYFPAMNARGEAVIKNAVKALKNLPDPAASLSTNQVSASLDAQTGYAVSQSVTYTSNVSGNDLSVTLPENVYLVTGSKEYKPGEKAFVAPGASFCLKKKGYSAAHTQVLTLKAAMFTDYEAYLINTSPQKQNMGFSFVAEKAFDLRVSWPDLVTRLTVIKTDSCTGSRTPSAHYRLDGAKYGIYGDEACTQLLETLTISDSMAVSEEKYYIGTTYYIAEIEPMPEYHLDGTVYAAVAEAGGKTQITSSDVPKTCRISLQKTDRETGEPFPQTTALSFAGAIFGVYTDESCTVRAKDMNGMEVPNLVTDGNGRAATDQNLLIGDYWIKELTPPEGFLLSEEILHISAETAAAKITGQDGDIALTCAEQIIRGNVDLMKIKNEKDQSVSGAAGVVFRFTYVSDPTVTFRVNAAAEGEPGDNRIVTDGEGYATTASAEYPAGTLIYGEWLIEEENTPEGYEPIAPITVMVNANGHTYRFNANDRRIHACVMIEKRDANTGSLLPLPGVTFRIYKGGDQVYMFDSTSRSLTGEWTTGPDGCVQLPDTLDYGTYTLCEDPDTMPEGYYCMEDRTFSVTSRETDTLSPLVVTAEEPPLMGKIRITKQDALSGDCLPGFTFRIIAAEDITDMTGTVRTGQGPDGQEIALTAGTVVDEVTTGGDGSAVSKPLFLGKYTIVETGKTDGYALSTESTGVTLLADREAAAAGTYAEQAVTIQNYPTTLVILKKDSHTQKPLPGAAFRISRPEDPDESPVEVTTDEKGEAALTMLSPDTSYTVEEIAVPSGYNADSEPQSFRVDENGLIDGKDKIELLFTNTPNLVRISKQEITGGAEIPGAVLTIRDASGTIIEKWTSSDQPHLVSGLKAGDYSLTEEIPAPGYATAETIRFTVTNRLTVQTVVMKDDVTKVRISKADITTGKQVPGARLIIRDAKGKTVASWKTGKKPHYIEKLPVGKYTLTEKTAPAGYEIAETVSFEVKDTGEIQKVVMYDAPKHTLSGRTGPGTPSRYSFAPLRTSVRTGDAAPLLFLLAVSALSLLAVLAILRRLRGKRT